MHRLLPPTSRCFRRAAMLAVVLLAGCTDGTGPAPRAASLELSARQLSLSEGAADTLSATVRDDGGRQLTGLAVAWTVDDTAVAAVDPAGVVRGRRQGIAFVVASVPRDGGGTLRDSARVTVTAAAVFPRVDAMGMYGVAAEGQTTPVWFVVRDRDGRGRPGVEMRFQVVRGAGKLVAERAVTDSMGAAHAALAAGAEPIDVVVQASAAGVDRPAVFTVRYARAGGGLDPDPLVLTPGCAKWIRLYIRDPATGQEINGTSAAFSGADTSVVGLAVPQISGFYRGTTMNVSAKRLGETRLVARWLYGNLSDTATIRVVPPELVKLTLADSSLTVGIGGRTGTPSYVTDQCGVARAGAVAYRSLDPDVVATDRMFDGYPLAVGLRPGVGRVVAELGALRDTLRVEVVDVRLLPADTTVAVGATVKYRAVRVDAAGNQTPANLTSMYPFTPSSPTVSVDWQALTVRALAPGTATVGGLVDASLDLGARIHVVAPPGS